MPLASRPPRAAKDYVAISQGAYWLVTGVWPLVHMDSFEAITGRKRDKWLVKTAGLLISCVGGFLLWKGVCRRTDEADAALGASAAASLTAIDVWYTAEGKIPPIYLADAVAEVGLIGAWGIAHELDKQNDRAVARRMNG
jgi:ABC-type nickel/cobalt efflux system permease component RcnA